MFAVVVAAEQGEVVQAGRSAGPPGDHMMGLTPGGRDGAAGVAAALVAGGERVGIQARHVVAGQAQAGGCQPSIQRTKVARADPAEYQILIHRHADGAVAVRALLQVTLQRGEAGHLFLADQIVADQDVVDAHRDARAARWHRHAPPRRGSRRIAGVPVGVSCLAFDAFDHECLTCAADALAGPEFREQSGSAPPAAIPSAIPTATASSSTATAPRDIRRLCRRPRP